MVTSVSVDALETVRKPVDEILAAFLDRRVAELEELDPGLTAVGNEVADLVATGGKHLRPAFVYWGHRATGAAHDEAVLYPAAAVQLLHTFALLHDDVMDRSPERRGRASAFQSLADLHRRQNLEGDAAWFGIGGAILAGDLAFVWADQMFDATPVGAEVLNRARRVFTTLRVEVMAGQYLDMRLAGLPTATQDDALRVALLKSGRYTVTRPLQLGAAVGGGDGVLDETLQRYGDAVGVAFQLRDDILGMFGDPESTGKGDLDDLREGKRTVLVLKTLQRATAPQRDALQQVLGSRGLGDADADRVRGIVEESGALAEVEALIARQRAAAETALQEIRGDARGPLTDLADLAAFRAV
ncbi:MAG: polyprenyl synthetase family protein [Nitriliruptorales bacterium]|nr:polyprenyl synthetase family protein [Nitriliruptorales bacterium]